MSELDPEQLTAELRDIGIALTVNEERMHKLADELREAQERHVDLLSSFGTVADAALREALPEGHPYTKPLSFDAAPPPEEES